jgi:hypothetical protein
MRFKTAVIAAFATAALLFAPVSSMAAAPKPGAVCAKLGARAVSAGYRYTCVKTSKKKLVWKKGAKVAVVTPKPIASGEPNPGTPTPSPTTDGALWVRVANGIFNEQLTMKPGKVLQIAFLNSPNATNASAQEFRDSYQSAMTYWSNFIQSDSPIRWVVVTEKDKDWWVKTMTPLADSNWSPGWWGSAHCDQSAKTICGAGDTAADGSPLFTGFVGSQSHWDGQNTVNALHEATHVYQKLLLKKYMNAMPCWYAEGQATLFGIALGQKAQAMDISRARELEQLSQQIPESRTWDATGWATALQDRENFSGECQSTHFGYAAGYLVNEKLMDEFGHQKVMEWERLSASTEDWKGAFAKVFGIKVDAWYRDSAAPYIDSQALN